MATANAATEIILLVDDEEPVRRTFREWLEGAGLDCTVLSAADAEQALRLANQQAVDLAILDWNLGAGDDGLQLLQDLFAFHPAIVAILVTGYANQATPLDAMRMGVRDYLDKNHDLNRDTFLAAVRKQLEQLRPAKRARRLHQSLVAFRETVEKILPLVQSASALSDPVGLPDAVAALVRFLVHITHAQEGVLLVRHYDPTRTPAETCRAFDSRGQTLMEPLVPFARSIASAALSRQEPSVLNDLDKTGGAMDLQPFERGRHALLAAPLAVGAGVQAVLELFDPPSGRFSADDQRLVQVAAELGAELLRHALGQRQTNQLLVDAVAAALQASEQMAQSLQGTAEERLEQPPPAPVLDQLREGLRSTSEGDRAAADASLRLVEAIRVLARRHGPAALDHCERLVDSVRQLLDAVTV